MLRFRPLIQGHQERARSYGTSPNYRQPVFGWEVAASLDVEAGTLVLAFNDRIRGFELSLLEVIGFFAELDSSSEYARRKRARPEACTLEACVPRVFSIPGVVNVNARPAQSV
jgi:hypothetical protein